MEKEISVAAESAELQLPEQFRTINSPNSIVYTCVFYRYHILSCNPTFLESFNLQPADKATFDLRSLFDGDDLDVFVSSCERGSENFRGYLQYNIPGRFRESVRLFTYLFHFPLEDKICHGLLAYEMEEPGLPADIPSLENSVSGVFADNVTEMVEVVSANYSYTYVNDRACEYFGRSREELLHMSSLDTIYPEDLPYSLEFLRGVMSGKIPTFEIEVRSLHSSGRPMWTHFSGRAIVDESNHAIGYLSVGWDITERKLEEERQAALNAQLEEMVAARTAQLEEANRQLSAVNEDINAIFMNIPAGILVADENGRVTSRNDYLHQAFGKDLKHITQTLSEVIKDKSNVHIRRLFEEARPFKNVEIAFSARSGREDYFFMTGVLQKQSEPRMRSAILVLTPGQEVLGLANRISGADTKFQFENIITQSPRMLRAIENAKSAAGNMGNVLITGESGTGKEMFAQSIHNYSARRKGPFIGINCGAIPRELLASELFGYTDGAFTGATKGGKPGKFELAAGGTLFLDEIGDMPLEQQVALLRVIQEKSVTKIGGSKPIPVDCRIICATNVNLPAEIERNNFRRDLYYRLNVINLHVTPLRERKGDIPLLLEHFIDALARRQAGSGFHLPPEFLPWFTAYNWPGNVRELQNVIERLFYLAADAPLTLDSLPREMLRAPAMVSPDTPGPALVSAPPGCIADALSMEKERRQAREREQILALLEQHDGNISRVAKELGVARSTLYNKIKKY